MDSLGPVLGLGAALVIVVIGAWMVISLLRWVFGVSDNGIRPCPECNGLGYESKRSAGINTYNGAQPIHNQKICSFCGGRGKMRFRIKITERACPDCKGLGYRVETRVRPPGLFRGAEEYPVHVPCHYPGDRNYGGSVVTSACFRGKVRRTEEIWEEL